MLQPSKPLKRYKNLRSLQKIISCPTVLKLSLPNTNNLKFSDKISIYHMFLESSAFLHSVDIATHFSAVMFLDSNGNLYGQLVDVSWLLFIQTWCTSYTGFLNRFRTDQRSAFASDRWKQLTNLNVLEIRLSGVQAHSSMRVGERLHQAPQTVYRKLKTIILTSLSI